MSDMPHHVKVGIIHDLATLCRHYGMTKPHNSDIVVLRKKMPILNHDVKLSFAGDALLVSMVTYMEHYVSQEMLVTMHWKENYLHWETIGQSGSHQVTGFYNIIAKKASLLVMLSEAR